MVELSSKQIIKEIVNKFSDKFKITRHLSQWWSFFGGIVFTVVGYDKIFIHHENKHAGMDIKSILNTGKYVFFIKLLGVKIFPIKKQIQVYFDSPCDNLKIVLI